MTGSLTFLEAQFICVALVTVDIIARAFRIRWLLAGTGERITLGDALVLNAFGDAACAITPLRLGGEPARLAGMLRAGVPAPAGLVAIGFEVLAAWPVIIAVMLPLAWRHLPGWWDTAVPAMGRTVATAWPWLLAAVALGVPAWVVARRWRGRAPRRIGWSLHRARVYWRRMPIGPILASVPMTLLNLGSRVGILVALALTLPEPAAVGTLVIGSFMLLYAQLILPAPSGAGVVDFGFLAGAAGHLGGRGALLLLAWRFYTSGVGLLLGTGLALRLYGWTALLRVIRRRAVVPSQPA